MSTDASHLPNDSKPPASDTTLPSSNLDLLNVSLAPPTPPVKPETPSASTPASPITIASATDIDSLPDDPILLKQIFAETLRQFQDAFDKSEREKEALQDRLQKLLRRFFGPKSEKFDPNQPLFFPDMTTAPETPPSETPVVEAADTPPTENADASPKSKGRHGRRKPSGELWRVEKVHDVPEAEKVCSCCGQAKTKIGEDRGEQVEYEPASIFVIVHVRPKYVCRKCQDGVTMAPLPEQPIAKGLPGPGLLAYVAVSRFCDHLPYYRLENILERMGLHVVRSTMCDWMSSIADLMSPLYDLMKRRVLLSKVIWTDDTPIRVQNGKDDETGTKGGTHQGRVWAYIGNYLYPYTVFTYTPNRRQDGADAPLDVLAGWTGTLQADAYKGYDALFAIDPLGKTAKVFEAGCNAHARRYFVDARTTDPIRANAALVWYAQLYKIEKDAKEQAEKEVGNSDSDAYFEKLAVIRLKLRQERSLPILDKFHIWLVAEKDKVVPKSPMAVAINYVLNNWDALCRFSQDGFVDIDNNVAERAMRALKLGMKNWLFFAHDNGGKTAAILYSFIAGCQRNGVEPFAYLRDVLERLPTHPAERLDELLPDRWKKLRTLAVTSPSLSPAGSSPESSSAIDLSSPPTDPIT
jgi:transposase